MADYCCAEEVKAQIEKTTTTSDAVIEMLIKAASRAIDNKCNRPDGFVALASGSETDRTYAGSGKGWQYIDECVAVTALGVKDSPTDASYTAWLGTDYILARGDPARPDFNRTPYNLLIVDPTGDYSHFTSGAYSYRPGFRPDYDTGYRGVPTVRVTARWGYAATVPDAIKQACIIEVARWLKRGQSAWNDALGSPDLGMLMYKQGLDPATVFLLEQGRYIRPALG